MVVQKLHHALLAAMQHLPRPVIWRFSRRYIAGVHLEDACRVVQGLNVSGCSATVDVLGEDSTTPAQVESALDLYLETIRAIHASSMDCSISVKLSEFGLRFDVPLCQEAMVTLLSSARDHGIFVCIDMEDSSVTSLTLDIYRELRTRFDNIGIAIQSCLRRSENDIGELLRGGPTNVRLCKGIYVEPEAIAFRDAEEIRTSYRRLLLQLITGGAKHIGIATHDPLLVAHAAELISNQRVPRDRYEFQMLLGVAGTLRKQLVAEGRPVRVYVPFGEHWFPYSMRRMRENPQLVGHILGNLLTAR